MYTHKYHRNAKTVQYFITKAVGKDADELKAVGIATYFAFTLNNCKEASSRFIRISKETSPGTLRFSDELDETQKKEYETKIIARGAEIIARDGEIHGLSKQIATLELNLLNAQSDDSSDLISTLRGQLDEWELLFRSDEVNDVKERLATENYVLERSVVTASDACLDAETKLRLMTEYKDTTVDDLKESQLETKACHEQKADLAQRLIGKQKDIDGFVIDLQQSRAKTRNLEMDWTDTKYGKEAIGRSFVFLFYSVSDFFRGFLWWKDGKSNDTKS